jgi:hypothetical protein
MEEGERRRGKWMSGYGSVPEDTSRGGARWGVLDPATAGTSMPVRAVEQMGSTRELRWSEVVGE